MASGDALNVGASSSSGGSRVAPRINPSGTAGHEQLPKELHDMKIRDDSQGDEKVKFLLCEQSNVYIDPFPVTMLYFALLSFL